MWGVASVRLWCRALSPVACAHAQRRPQRHSDSTRACCEKPQQTRRNRRAQCAGARQQRARWREVGSGPAARSRERAPKTGAKAPRECAERRLQGRRSAAPPPPRATHALRGRSEDAGAARPVLPFVRPLPIILPRRRFAVCCVPSYQGQGSQTNSWSIPTCSAFLIKMHNT